VPFPFIMFGEISLIEKLDDVTISNPDNFDINVKKNRIFFTGSLFVHDDKEINYYRNRKEIYNKLEKYIYNPGALKYWEFLDAIKTSKYCLDLNGVGDPNKRTFEILSHHSLRLAEYNDLKWPFEEYFSEETIFTHEEDFIKKLYALESDIELYKKCLREQTIIVLKYFNKQWIKNYLLSFI